MGTTETELKLALSPDAAKKLLKAKRVKRLQVGPAKHRRLVSTYFDTPRHVLRKSGIALRLRNDGNHQIQTIKTPTHGPAGLQNYREWTVPVLGDRPDLRGAREARLPPSLSRRRGQDRLRPVFTTEVERTIVRLQTRRAQVELAIDEGIIKAGHNGGTRMEPICEAEFELLSGDPTEILELALDVCETLEARPIHVTKAQRGYALSRQALRPRARKAKPAPLRTEKNAMQAFQSIIGDALKHLFDNQPPTLRGHPSGLHQTRVAMRRLRATMRAFKKILPYHERKAFNSEFRWFQRRLAPARDWHVFLTETLPLIAASGSAREEQTDTLRKLARYERRRATKAALVYLQSRRYARLILKFQKWIATLENTVAESILDQPLVPFARQVMRKTRRDLLRETRPLSSITLEDLHDVRKRGKKARYAIESFSSLWNNSETRPYLRMMERLQDRLGEANDACVAGHILLTLRPGRVDAELVQVVHDWSQQRTRNRVDAARPHWSRFRKAKPFWLTDPDDRRVEAPQHVRRQPSETPDMELTVAAP